MMVKKKYIITIIVVVILSLLFIGVVGATEVTMRVDSKHIVGTGTGNTPVRDDFCNVIYVLSERQMDGTSDKYIIQEYPVTLEDYCKVKIGDTVTLKVPNSQNTVFKIINNNGG